MICSISGLVPQEPVVSKSSGFVFEKSLIELHIAKCGECPVTGETLALEDLVAIKTAKVEKQIVPSISGILGLVQREFDALVVSAFENEKKLEITQQELKHRLLELDSATRVIEWTKKELYEARKMHALTEEELEKARKRLAQLEICVKGDTKDDEVGSRCKRKRTGEDDPHSKRNRPGISASILSEFETFGAEVSQKRKGRKVSATLASVDVVECYTQLSSYPLHRNTKAGILSIDIHQSKDIIATGIDTTVIVFDHSLGVIKSTLSGHSKKVTSVKFVGDGELLVSGSTDKTVRVWQADENGDYNCRHILKDHRAEVQAVTVHGTNKYLLTASVNNSWCFYELSSGLCLSQVEDSSVSFTYTCAAFHPDGRFFGIGTSGSVVNLWDVNKQGIISKIDGHVGAVNAISFSENGYYLATAAQDGVKLWDLRKGENFKTLSPYDEHTPTKCVEFDHSGSYLVIGGSDIRVYQVGNARSEWSCIKTLPYLSKTGKINSVRFGPDAKYLAAGSMNHELQLFGFPGEDSEKKFL